MFIVLFLSYISIFFAVIVIFTIFFQGWIMCYCVTTVYLDVYRQSIRHRAITCYITLEPSVDAISTSYLCSLSAITVCANSCHPITHSWSTPPAKKRMTACMESWLLSGVKCQNQFHYTSPIVLIHYLASPVGTITAECVLALDDQMWVCSGPCDQIWIFCGYEGWQIWACWA